jgi:twinkle protein
LPCEQNQDPFDFAGNIFLADLPQGTSIDKVVRSVGYLELDPLLKIYPGQLVVTTGSAGSGKSTFLFNLIVNICWKYGDKAWVYAPENELYLRDKFRRLFNGHDRNFEIFAKERCIVRSSNYERYHAAPRDIDWIVRNAYDQWDKHGAKIYLIDPWNELEQAKARDENLTDYIGRCLQHIKVFGRETGSTVFMVAHPTKASVGRDVTLSDIEGSMHWYNKCDNGLIVKRQEKDTMVISAKVREQPYAGTLGHHLFLVDQQTGIFHEQQGGTFL